MMGRYHMSNNRYSAIQNYQHLSLDDLRVELAKVEGQIRNHVPVKVPAMPKGACELCAMDGTGPNGKGYPEIIHTFNGQALAIWTRKRTFMGEIYYEGPSGTKSSKFKLIKDYQLVCADGSPEYAKAKAHFQARALNEQKGVWEEFANDLLKLIAEKEEKLAQELKIEAENKAQEERNRVNGLRIKLQQAAVEKMIREKTPEELLEIANSDEELAKILVNLV